MEDKITCNHCHKSTTPRLWHIKGNFFRRKKIQHICPFCGQTMYETGGGVGGGIILTGVAMLYFSFMIFSQESNHKKTKLHELQQKVTYQKNELNKYKDLYLSLLEKTKDGKSPHLKKQVNAAQTRVEKLKKRLDESQLEFERFSREIKNNN